MRTLVTGASGPFGRKAVTLLLERLPASDLVLCSRTPEKLGELAQAGCDVHFGDFEQPESIERAAEGVDKMLLISGHKVGHRIKQHGDAIDAARRAGVGHIVYTSYFGSTAESTALVCIDHHGTEEKLKASGLAWTALRNGMYANTLVDAVFPAALATGRWLSSAGSGKVSLVDRDDCVACAVEVLTTDGHENRVYNITPAELWSFGEMLELASEATGKPIELVLVGDDEFYAYLEGIGIPRTADAEFNVGGFAWCCDDITSFEREVRNGRFEITSHDIESLLGREPKLFREFVDERAEWLREVAAAPAPSAS